MTNQDLFQSPVMEDGWFMLMLSGHTQSEDGLFLISNPGGSATDSCIPGNHKGFAVTRFLTPSDTPVSYDREYFRKYAYSFNWCPEEFRGISGRSADFWGWNFTNNSRYVSGRQLWPAGSHALWIVDWISN
ncbi:MAG: hypothetical protein JNL74_12570, partial [Fibrobacteres bacterium]|nr:hypothetical protein [Fibrobacterota bacterium]